MKTKLFSLIAILAITFCVSSCSPKVYGLRGNYAITNSVESSLSFDEVWNNVIDFFSANNIPIATLEKASGIIVASNVNIPESFVAVENEQGKISNSKAWFVFPYFKNQIGGRVECSFNVRVRQQENGKVFISVNLGSIVGYKDIMEWSPITFRNEIFKTTVPTACYSTGKFENDMLNQFK